MAIMDMEDMAMVMVMATDMVRDILIKMIHFHLQRLYQNGLGGWIQKNGIEKSVKETGYNANINHRRCRIYRF